jgi:hypothetical protein
MAGCGGLLGFLGRARKERKGSFIAAQRRFRLTVVAYRKPQHGRGAAGTCGGAVGQRAEAVRPLASVHRLRGTGLVLHASVTTI